MGGVDGEASDLAQHRQAKQRCSVGYSGDRVVGDVVADRHRDDADCPLVFPCAIGECQQPLWKLDRLFRGDQGICNAGWDAADGCAGIDDHVERARSRPLAERDTGGELAVSVGCERHDRRTLLVARPKRGSRGSDHN